MFDCTLDEPSHSLQSGVRVGGNHHAVCLLGWAKVINKAPGADHFQFAVRQRATNLYPGAGSEFDGAGFDQHFTKSNR